MLIYIVLQVLSMRKGEDYEKKRQVTLININNCTCEEKKEESVDYYNFHSTKYQRE